MSRIAIRNQVNFRTKNFNGETQHHVIDQGWNHKIGKRVVNPKEPTYSLDPDPHVTSTYNPKQEDQGLVEKTGSIFDTQKSFIYFDRDEHATVRVIRNTEGNIVKLPI